VSDSVEPAVSRGPASTDASADPIRPATRRERRELEAAAARSASRPSRQAVASTPAPAVPVAPARVAAPVVAAPAPSRRPGRIRSRISAVGTMAAVAAMIGVFALPAYALTADEDVVASAGAPSSAAAQTFDVADDALTVALDRDAFSATSYQEILEEQAALYRSSYGLSAAAEGDDYPFRGGYGLSALGYYMGQCTDFVAWRLNRDAGAWSAPWVYTWSVMTPWGGDADDWLGAWQRNGWPVSSTPMAGAVAWFGGNHVGYVRQVYADGSFMIEDYNRVGYETYAAEIFAPGSIPYFLYPPGL